MTEPQQPRPSTPKGLPTTDRLTLHQEDGTELEFASPVSGPERALDVVEPIPQSFAQPNQERGSWSPACPICLGEGPLTEEHVPQEPLGGVEMTMTCDRCNNFSGLESSLTCSTGSTTHWSMSDSSTRMYKGRAELLDCSTARASKASAW